MGQTVGIFGSGYSDGQTVRDLLEGTLDDNTRVILALTERHWTKTMKSLVEFVVDLWDLDYEVVIDESALNVKELTPYIQGAARVHKVQRIPHKVVNLLFKAPDGASLFLLWNDEDEENMVALERATEKEIPTFDLCNDLEALEFEDNDPPGLGLANLLAVSKTKTGEPDEDEEYDEGVLVVMSKDELIELLEQTIINSLRRFRNGE